MFVEVQDLSAAHAHIVRQSLWWFNSDEARAQKLALFLRGGQRDCSLRLVDHLVVHYSRDVYVSIRDTDETLDLWSEYHRMLRAKTKEYFDVFKRQNLLAVRVLGAEYQSAVSQIVFLAWFLQLGMDAYLAENCKQIREHINKRTALKKAVPLAHRGVRTAVRGDVVKPHARAHSGDFSVRF